MGYSKRNEPYRNGRYSPLALRREDGTRISDLAAYFIDTISDQFMEGLFIPEVEGYDFDRFTGIQPEG